MFRLMEKARNRNNKGFSLVELIVVVLIIAIIAVALAPQVIKYVNKARTSVEDNNRATIQSSVQAAVAEYEGQTAANSTLDKCSFYIDATKSEIKSMPTNVNKAPASTGSKSLQELIQENLGGDSLDQNYGVTIDSNGTVTVTAMGNSKTKPTI